MRPLEFFHRLRNWGGGRFPVSPGPCKLTECGFFMSFAIWPLSRLALGPPSRSGPLFFLPLVEQGQGQGQQWLCSSLLSFQPAQLPGGWRLRQALYRRPSAREQLPLKGNISQRNIYLPHKCEFMGLLSKLFTSEATLVKRKTGKLKALPLSSAGAWEETPK